MTKDLVWGLVVIRGVLGGAGGYRTKRLEGIL